MEVEQIVKQYDAIIIGAGMGGLAAGVLMAHAGKKVVFDLPDEKEKAGFSTATKALLDNNKLKIKLCESVQSVANKKTPVTQM